MMYRTQQKKTDILKLTPWTPSLPRSSLSDLRSKSYLKIKCTSLDQRTTAQGQEAAEAAITLAAATTFSRELLTHKYVSHYLIRAVTNHLPKARSIASTLPLIGALSAGFHSFYEIGKALYGAYQRENSWRYVVMTAVACGLETVGGLWGYGAGEVSRQVFVEASKCLVDRHDVAEDTATIKLIKDGMNLIRPLVNRAYTWIKRQDGPIECLSGLKGCALS